MGQTAYSIAVQQMGELIEKANLNASAVEKALEPINAQLADTTKNLAGRGINVMHPPIPLIAAIGDGLTDDSDAINAISLFAKDNDLAVIFPAGVYRCTKTINFYEGVRYFGANSGSNWRPAPNSVSPSGTFRPGLYEIQKGTVLLFTGDGAKTKTIDNVTVSTQNGYDRDNPIRPFTNANDARFELKDFTNANATGVTKATLKAFSTAVEIIGNSERRVIVEDIRIITSCPANGETYGTSGYAVDSEVLPFVKWDVGLFMQSPWRCEFNNVEVVGYWGLAGMLLYPQREGDANAGYAEHNIFRNCVIQSGTVIRGGDTWPVLSKTSNSITVRWTASHRFNPSGSIRMGTSFSDNSKYDYTGLTYDNVNGTLTFTGISDTSAITVTGDDRQHIITTVGGGFAHTIFYDCELYDFSHSTLLDDADPLINRNYGASLELSGNPMRAVKFYNTIFSPLGRVAIHAGKAWDIEMYSCYIEPRRGRSTLGGELDSRGSVIIWGPKTSMEAEVGIKTGNGGHVRMYGRTLHPSVNASPTLLVNSGYRYSSLVDGDFFNPHSVFYDHEQFRLDERATRLWGNRGYDVDIRLRKVDGSLIRMARGLPSGTLNLGDDGTGLGRIVIPNSSIIQLRGTVNSNSDNLYSMGTATFRYKDFYAGNATIQTSDEREKEQIEGIPDSWLDAWENVQYKRFKYKDAVADKRENARWHVGVIAQQVQQAFADKGIDAFEIGLLCYDEWEDQYDESDKGPVFVKAAGNRYAIRYDEAQTIEAAYQRRKIERLEAMINQ